MRTSTLVRKLRDAMNERRIVRIYRPSLEEDAEDGIDGFIVSMNDEFVVLHVVSGEIVLDGFYAMPIRNIERLSTRFSSQEFQERAVALRRQKPKAVTFLKLDDWRSILVSANRKFPLVTIFRERYRPEACWIGKIESVRPSTFLLKYINPDATWKEKPRSYRYSDLTLVGFGGGYEAALWMVANDKPRKSRRKLTAK